MEKFFTPKLNIMQKRIKIKFSEKHPELSKYLDNNGRYNPFKSEAIREEYKDERARHGKSFNSTVNNMWEKIFPKPAFSS